MMIMSIMMKESFLQTQAMVTSFIAQKLNPAKWVLGFRVMVLENSPPSRLSSPSHWETWAI